MLDNGTVDGGGEAKQIDPLQGIMQLHTLTKTKFRLHDSILKVLYTVLHKAHAVQDEGYVLSYQYSRPLRNFLLFLRNSPLKNCENSWGEK